MSSLKSIETKMSDSSQQAALLGVGVLCQLKHVSYPAVHSQVGLTVTRHWTFWGPLNSMGSRLFPSRITVQKVVSFTKQQP